MEALAVRRATVTDADKVRYRVYTSKTEYVAVIAESALMALRVSGIEDPHRIVRDLPTEGVAIAAERMDAGDSGQRVSLATEKAPREKAVVAPMPTNAEPTNANFMPLKIGDLDQKSRRTMRILSAKDLERLTAQSPKAEAAPPAAEATLLPAPLPADTGELSPEQVQALLNE